MTEDARATSQNDEGPGLAHPFLLWFGFLGGAAAWAVHLGVVYGLVEISCHSDRLAFTILGIAASGFLSLLVTAVAALTAVSAAIIAFFSQPRFLERVEEAGAPEARGRGRFMAYTGMIMSGLFAVAILSGGLPFFFLRTC
jgi:hypothetical protein